MFYLNTIEQLFLFVEKLDQLEVCLPYSRLLTGIPILAVFQNLKWNSNKTSLSDTIHTIALKKVGDKIISNSKVCPQTALSVTMNHLRIWSYENFLLDYVTFTFNIKQVVMV